MLGVFELKTALVSILLQKLDKDSNPAHNVTSLYSPTLSALGLHERDKILHVLTYNV